jgi:hypothetical protein
MLYSTVGGEGTVGINLEEFKYKYFTYIFEQIDYFEVDPHYGCGLFTARNCLAAIRCSDLLCSFSEQRAMIHILNVVFRYSYNAAMVYEQDVTTWRKNLAMLHSHYRDNGNKFPDGLDKIIYLEWLIN